MKNENMKPIIIQGAMDIEIEYLVEQLTNVKKVKIGGFTFFKGEFCSYPVIVSKTEIGTINCTMVTTISIMKFNPLFIINQGIAGAHISSIHNGDIIIGEECVNINEFLIPTKDLGQGSNPFHWKYNNDNIKYICKDNRLIESAKKVEYKNGNLYFGTIGSGDVFNREVDRINWIHEQKDTLCEEMESIGMYAACRRYSVPGIGIRAISNNEITREKYDRTVAIFSQEFALELIKKYIE